MSPNVQRCIRNVQVGHMPWAPFEGGTRSLGCRCHHHLLLILVPLLLWRLLLNLQRRGNRTTGSWGYCQCFLLRCRTWKWRHNFVTSMPWVPLLPEMALQRLFAIYDQNTTWAMMRLTSLWWAAFILSVSCPCLGAHLLQHSLILLLVCSNQNNVLLCTVNFQ